MLGYKMQPISRLAAAFALALLSGLLGSRVTFCHAQSSSDMLRTSVPEISYVLDPFESKSRQDWFETTLDSSESSGMNVTVSQDDFLFGDASLRVEYDLEKMAKTSSSNASLTMTFGWLQPDVPHNCFGASHISLWYKVLEPNSISTVGSSNAEWKVTLLDDSHCGDSATGGFCPANMTGTMGSNLEHYSYTSPVMTLSAANGSSSEWQELRVNVNDMMLDAAAGATGNEQLDLNRLRGWHVELLVDSASVALAVDNSPLVVLFDQLACKGGGDLLGSSFHQGQDAKWESLVEEGIWDAEYYQSNISEAETNIVLQDGTMSADYTVQTVENWGGYIGLAVKAPGEAYWNLTGATDWHFSYHTRMAASAPDRTHLRLIVSDASHCVVDCSPERWYSFNFILDDNVTDDGKGDIYLPLVGSREPSTPFWLTGWSGEIGNGELDIANIKGYTLEFTIDGEDMNSTVSGGLDMFNMSALVVVYNETSDDISGVCVAEADLHLNENSILFRKHDFLGKKCCEVCQEDETCLYALSTGWDCFVASYMDAGTVSILNTEILQRDLKAFWMDDPVRRGDFCDICECRESDRTVDCRDRDLMIVPKTFYHDIEEEISWTPRVLDLRNNSKLVILGAGSLNSISAELEELWLPKELRHISQASVSGLPMLSSVKFEEMEQLGLSNAIVEPSGAFGDVCCSRGSNVDVSLPLAGITFCDMIIDQPGIDSKYLPFTQFPDATTVRLLTPSSKFMSEAAGSLNKCAEYCAISSDCSFFSYDARLQNAEHMCYLLSNNGAGAFDVCCDADHYADDAGTLPGWVSGLPPRTRHEVDHARVLLDPTYVVVDSSNDYSTVFEVSLGSTPLRGAVWIEPTLVSSTDLQVSFVPPQVVLYDSNSTVLVTVKVSNLATSSKTVSLVVKSVIKSCDVAFMESSGAVASQETTLFIDVVMPESENDSNAVIVVTVALAVVVLVALGIFFYIERKRKLNDAVWQVKPEDLKFDEPPEILGRGSFGLVLKASYRGTEVAVKRVIPPREKTARGRRSSMGGSIGSSEKRSIVSGSSNGMFSGTFKTNPKSAGPTSTILGSQSLMTTWNTMDVFARSGKDASYTKLKGDFIKEMRYLSKLRHPAITTVMGAVISGKAEPMLIMEYMDHGSLYDLLHNETVMIEGELVLPLLRDITQGVRFLHSCDPAAIHGDLKAANILVDSRFRAKVADFGLSQKKRLGATGTPFWMAPELLQGVSGNTTASDVYSFGIILYEVYSRADPYEGEDTNEVIRLVKDKVVNKRPVPRHMPGPMQSLMNDCLVRDPEERPSFDELDQRLKRADAKSVEPTNSQKRVVKDGNISLFDIFPRHIAEALQEGRKVEPEHKDCVTIFFSDIVGFTDISSTLDPRKVANLLDRLYSKLDDLSDKHDLYKVETIGDAYMCCGNLVTDQPEDHVKRIAEFAADAIVAANDTQVDLENPELGFVNIRVGFHSGPVVADVVGNRNPRFCLFGDTVNVASRMESSSEPGRIHCSKVSADLLAQQAPLMPLSSRGKIKIKGKGDMHTFWVDKEGDEIPQESAPGHQMLDYSIKNYSMRNIEEEHSSTNFSSSFGLMITGDDLDSADAVPSFNNVADEGWVSGSFVDV